jgi:hypothetical protein
MTKGIDDYLLKRSMKHLEQTLDKTERAKAIHDIPYKFLGITLKHPPRHTMEYFDRKITGYQDGLVANIITQYKCVVCGKSEFEDKWYKKIAGDWYMEAQLSDD